MARNTTSSKKASRVSPKILRMSEKRSLTSRLPRLNMGKLLVLLAIVAGVLLLYLYRDTRIAAIVNHRPISRIAVLNELEKVKQGDVEQVTSNMVDKILIMQEAKKRGVIVSEGDINGEIEKIEQNMKQYGQTLDAQLQSLGLTREGLRENIRVQKNCRKNDWYKYHSY